MNRTLLISVMVLVTLFAGYIIQGQVNAPAASTAVSDEIVAEEKDQSVIAGAELVTLSGTYVCLPLATGDAATVDCAFGIYTDAGEYYAVNFGAGAGSMADFREGERITAKGTIILTENLKPNNWVKFKSQGLFTVLEK